MDDQDFRKPEYSHIFFHVVNCFTVRAFVPTSVHPFRCGVSSDTFIDVNVSSVPHCLSWYRNRQVHKVIKGQRLIAGPAGTAQAALGNSADYFAIALGDNQQASGVVECLVL